MNKNSAIVEYSDYIRDYLSKNPPKDWRVDLFGEFPSSSNMFQKYFEYILSKNTNKSKILAIEKRYGLNRKDTIEQKAEVINGRTRSINKFFVNKTVPYEKNLNFIAFVFDVPINKFADFIENHKHREGKSTEKKVIEKTIEQHKEIPKNKIVKKTEEEEKPITETSIKTKVKSKTKRKLHKEVIFGTLLLILIVSGFMFFNFYVEKKVPVPNNTIKYSSFLPVDVGDKLFDGEVVPATNAADTGLSFHTVNIFNDKCLSKNKPWNFEVDSEGEDMNSQYGTPYNEDITTYHPTLNGRTTIANKKMELHFNITNNTDKTLYFANMKLKVVNTYDAVAEQTTYNLYVDRTVSQVFSVTLSDKNLYGFTMDPERIRPGGAMFFKCIITGDEKCNGLIYRYEIVADLVDTQGNHYEVKSDKNYLIGFLGN